MTPERPGHPGRGIAGEDILYGQTAAVDLTTGDVVLYDDLRTSPPIGTADVDIQCGSRVIYGHGRLGLNRESPK